MLSFEEATTALAKKRRISYEEAELIVAEHYDVYIKPDQEFIVFDDPDWVEPFNYSKPAPRGRVVRFDEELSPRAALNRERTVAADKMEGDRYRAMSRRTSLHVND